MDNDTTNLHSRVSSLETSVKSLHEDIKGVKDDMASGFRDITKTLEESNKTNWSTVIAGVALTIGLWAAAIHPINEQMDVHTKNDMRLSEKFDKLESEVKDLHIALSQGKAERMANEDTQQRQLDDLKKYVETLAANGTPAVQKRLEVIEWRIDHQQVSGKK